MIRMLKSLFKRKPPATFSEAWMSENASPSTSIDFEAAARTAGKFPIYHVTCPEWAASIHDQRSIHGEDVVSSAHFHWTIAGASRQARCSGAVLGFVWQGQPHKLNLNRDSSTHMDRRPNILFDVPVATYDPQTWELRLYPGSIGLELSFVQIGSKAHLLRKPVELEVVHSV